MAITDKSQNEIINAWQNLIEQSVKANTAFLEEFAKIFTDLLSKKTEPKDLLKINTAVLNAAANNFIKLNVTNTENLMNFGVTVSRSFFSFGDIKNDNDSNSGGDKAPQKPVGPAAPVVRNQINLSVKQGEQITTSFYLNSHNAFAQSGKFYYENFTGDVTGSVAGLSMFISPKEFILEPAKSLKVDVTIDAPATVSPGKYKSTVHLEGMDNQEFDMVVAVVQHEPVSKKVSRHIPVVKNRVAKKPPPKTKSKK